MSTPSFSAIGAGKERRLRRLIQSDGRALFVAVDHAAYMGAGPPLTVVEEIANGRPDGVLTTWHLARANATALASTGLVLRADGGVSELGPPAPADVSILMSNVDDALRVGADAMVVLAFPGTPDEAVSLQRLGLLCGECEKVGMPVMAEALPGGFVQAVDWTFENVARAARVAAELGADIIKTVCPGPAEEFAQVVEACPVPVVCLGGPKVDNEDDVIAFARNVVAAGAAGVAIGRNVWGSADPAKLVARLREAIHGSGDEVEPNSHLDHDDVVRVRTERVGSAYVEQPEEVAVSDAAPPVFDPSWIRTSPYPQVIAGKETADGDVFPLINPANGDAIGSWAEATADEVDRAIAAARESFDDGRWRRMPPVRRAEVLERAAHAIRDRVAELIGLDCVSTGKVFLGGITYDGYEAYNAFISNAAFVRELSGEVREAVFPPNLFPGGGDGPRILSLRSQEPAGVVAELLPWNAPLYTGSERIAAALAAGCSVVAKPSEESPASAVELAGILRDAGLPDGVFNVVLGRGETVGARMIRDPRVDLVSVTGSVETGTRVYEIAASNMKRVNLELGGKAPVVVFGDADLEAVSTWAMLAAFNNMGEVCVAGTRLLVERSAYDDVVAAVVGAATHLPIGDQFDPQTFIGPLVNAQHADRVRGFVDRAVASGATLAGGGTVPAGLSRAFVAPMVLGDVAPGSEIEQNEVFGPILAAQPFDSEEEALERANSTKYGLSASVFTSNIERAFRFAQRLEAGNVQVNHHYNADSSVPRGTPRRKSGTGLTGPKAYQAPKSIDINLGF